MRAEIEKFIAELRASDGPLPGMDGAAIEYVAKECADRLQAILDADPIVRLESTGLVLRQMLTMNTENVVKLGLSAWGDNGMIVATTEIATATHPHPVVALDTAARRLLPQVCQVGGLRR